MVYQAFSAFSACQLLFCITLPLLGFPILSCLPGPLAFLIMTLQVFDLFYHNFVYPFLCSFPVFRIFTLEYDFCGPPYPDHPPNLLPTFGLFLLEILTYVDGSNLLILIFCIKVFYYEISGELCVVDKTRVKVNGNAPWYWHWIERRKRVTIPYRAVRTLISWYGLLIELIELFLKEDDVDEKFAHDNEMGNEEKRYASVRDGRYDVVTPSVIRNGNVSKQGGNGLGQNGNGKGSWGKKKKGKRRSWKGSEFFC